VIMTCYKAKYSGTLKQIAKLKKLNGWIITTLISFLKLIKKSSK
jgi:hypothetical protein